MFYLRKVISSVVFNIIYCISAYASGGIDCADWVGKSSLCKGSSTIACDSTDLQVQECKDRFPTDWERIKIMRVGKHTWDSNITIEKQWCWSRIWTDNARCKSWRLNSDWQWEEYDAYYRTQDVTFSQAQIGTVKTIGDWSVCTNAVSPGMKTLHDTINTSDTTMICAYITTEIPRDTPSDQCPVPLLFRYDYALIGCVNQQVMPLPKTFNLVNREFTVDVDYKTPIVSANTADNTYIKMGSSFRYPMIRLLKVLKNQTYDLQLTYAFTGDVQPADKPNCASFQNEAYDGIVYCAVVEDNDPTSVCACIQGSCGTSNLGCVRRPTLAESNMDIVVQYQDYMQQNSLEPGLSVQFVELENDGFIHDADGMPIKQAIDGNFYKFDLSRKIITDIPANKPILKALPLPQAGQPSLREYVIATNKDGQSILDRDFIQAYGLKIQAIIPQIVDNLPRMIGISTNKSKFPCDIVAASPPTADIISASLMPVYNGWRDITTCCPLNNNSASKNPANTFNRACGLLYPDTNCLATDGAPLSDDIAVAAYCAGKYFSPIDFSKQDYICAYREEFVQWDSSLDIASGNAKCIKMPPRCLAVNVPTSSSGFAKWDSAMLPNTEQTGVCDLNYGLEQKITWSIEPLVNISNLDASARAEAEAELKNMSIFRDKMQSIYDSRTMNIPYGMMYNSKGKYYQYIYNACTPTRTCDKDNKITKVACPCVYAASCLRQLGSSFNGFASWEMNNPDYSAIKNSAGTKVGQCMFGYKQTNDSPPARECIAIDLYDIYNKKVSTPLYYWANNITNPCIAQ